MKRCLPFLLLALCASVSAQFVSAVFTNTSSGGGVTIDSNCNTQSDCPTPVSTNSISGTYSVGATAHPVVRIVLADNGSLATGASCTYGTTPVSMTKIGAEADGAGVTDVAVFLLAAPATGSQAWACSVTNSGGILGAFIDSYFGVNQSTPNRTPPTPANDGGSGTGTATITVSNAVSGDYVVDAVSCYCNSGKTLAVGSGQTQVFNSQLNATATVQAGSYKSATGSTTPTWTISASTFWADVAIALIPG